MSKKNACIRPWAAIHGESRFVERRAMYLQLTEYRPDLCHVTFVLFDFKNYSMEQFMQIIGTTTNLEPTRATTFLLLKLNQLLKATVNSAFTTSLFS